jgi:cytochrome c556
MPDVQETEHTPMLEAVGSPAAERVTPAMPRQAVQSGMARSLTEIEVAGGSSPADARARMNETAAIRQEAEQATPFPFDPISAADMRGHLDVLTAELRTLASRAAPGVAAD